MNKPKRPRYKPLPTTTVLSLGAGVQSSTMALMASKGEYGIPKPDFAVFADTQAEPQSVYDHLEWLIPQLDFEVIIDTNGNLRDDILAPNRYGSDFIEIPVYVEKVNGRKGITRRQCTSNYKIRVIEKVIRDRVVKSVGRKTFSTHTPIIQQIGISTDEAHRMRDNRHCAITNAYPLIDAGFSRSDCLQWFNQHYPNKILPRSACTFCPFHNNAEWKNLLINEPEAFEDAVFIDEQIRNKGNFDTGHYSYLHQSLKPLGELRDYFLAVEDKPDDESRNNNFGEECEGVCGV